MPCRTDIATPSRTRALLVWLAPMPIAFALLAATVLTGGAARAESPLAHRHPDPVIVPAAALAPELLGRSLESMVLMARLDGALALAPIPFQLDERDADGELVLTAGAGATRDEDEGHLDGNDELVFLARDAGQRSEELPVGADAVAEVRLTDPRSGREAWVYLASWPPGAAPSRSSIQYVNFDPERDEIRTAAYRLRFTDAERPFTVTWTSAPKSHGGAGIDFLDSVKLRLSGRLFGLKLVTRTDMDFDSHDRGHLAGPIRVVRMMATRLRLVGRLSAPGADVIRIYYPDWVESPVPIDLPFKIAAFFSDADVFFGSDFDLPQDGSHRYYSERFPQGIPIGSDLDRAERPAVPTDEVAWQGVSGPLGSSFSAVRLPESFPVRVETVFQISEDVDEPEEVPGASPLVGRRLVGWDGVPSGRHVARFYDFFPIAYAPGDEQPFMRMISDPVLVDVGPVWPTLSALPSVSTSAVP